MNPTDSKASTTSSLPTASCAFLREPPLFALEAKASLQAPKGFADRWLREQSWLGPDPIPLRAGDEILFEERGRDSIRVIIRQGGTRRVNASEHRWTDTGELLTHVHLYLRMGRAICTTLRTFTVDTTGEHAVVHQMEFRSSSALLRFSRSITRRQYRGLILRQVSDIAGAANRAFAKAGPN